MKPMSLSSSSMLSSKTSKMKSKVKNLKKQNNQTYMTPQQVVFWMYWIVTFIFFRKPVTFVILRFYQNCVLCILWEFGCLFIASISLMNIWEKCQHINKISVASWKWDKEYKNPVEIYDASRISNEAFHLNPKLESWWKTNHYGFWITNTNHLMKTLDFFQLKIKFEFCWGKRKSFL